MKGVKRRDFLKLSGTTLIGLTMGSAAMRAQAKEILTTDIQAAQALKYTPSSTVEGANCANCMYVQGKEGDEHRPCMLFPNHLVDAKGWCSGWVKRPS